MSGQLFKKLEKFRKQHKLSILKACKEIGCNNVTYHRWKKSKQIIGPYKKIVEEFLDKSEPHPQHPAAIPSEIAVIGIACYYPGAHNVKELWENILSRRVQFRRILDQRLPLKDYYSEDPRFPDKSYLTKAAFIDGFEFDWSKLRIPKKTFESTDIVHWLALDTALKTFENAGYEMDKIPLQNTGVILGNTLTGEQTRSLTLRLRWPYVQKTLDATLKSFGIKEEERSRLSEAMEKIYKSAFFPITEDSLSGGLANTIAGRICNYLNLKGGGYIVDGACSSSLLAVATAANALKLGEMDLVLAGGVDISLDPFELVGFSKVGALAKDQMRVYDQRAEGFIPGEGCGFVLLKRLEDAVKDKDYIYAVIKGWGISSDGKGGIMEPSSGGQATAIQRAYKQAGYTLADVDFIEGHGTGTTKGDRVELEGIATALKMARQDRHKKAAKRMDGRLCGVTSFKSIVGHTKAAAGIGGFIKAVLAVNQRILPPTANCQQPNEVFENEAKQLYPLIHGSIYSPEKTVKAGISSAGFGGINCHITIESKAEPNKKLKPEITEEALFASNQNTEVFVFASRTITHLQKLIQKFKEDLRNISMAEMADLSARLNKKVKANAPIKIAVVTDSPEHLYEALCAVEKELELGSLQEGQILEVKSSDPLTFILLGNRVKDNRIGFLYSGQGAQRLNMTRTLVERFAWARDLLNITRLPIGEYVYKPEDQFLTKEEKEEFRMKLSRTEITQPAIAFSSLVWTEFLSKLDIEPEAAGGHSLGELLAFYKGGAFDKKTLLRFAELRGKSMAAGSKSAGMVSLFCDYSRAKEIVSRVKGNIVISNINSPNQTVVSGGKKEIERVIELAKTENIATYLLPVSNAFHSSFMEEASKKVQSARILEETFRPAKIKIYSCIDGRVIEDKVNLREYFAKQILSPVNFIKLVESMSEKCDLFIEVGPGRILTDLVKAINKNKGPQCFPLEGTPQNDRDLNVVLAQLFIRNVKINWQELYRNRLIKPFVPASKRKFIENQCERPLKGVEQKEMFFSKVVAPVQAEAIQPQTQLPTPAISAPVAASADSVAKVLLDLTHKVTGFDEQSLNLNLRLLDDLNLDSIKAAELIAEAAKVLGLSGQIDPSQFSNNTLAQIRDRFAELKSQASQTVGGVDNVLLRYQRNTWVRNFIVKFEDEKIKQLDSAVFKRLNKIDILSDDSQREIAYGLKRTLKDKRIEARIRSYDELEKTKTDAVGLICILPANHKKEPFEETTLKRIIDRFYHVMTTATHDGSEKESAVVFVQFGGGSFGENDKVNIESCCARSFASTLHLERPDLRIRVLDFDKSIEADVVSKLVVEELQTPVLFSVAGYDKSLTRRVPVFQNTQPAFYKKRNIQLSYKDVVLVTGGAKGITAECALEFARRTKAQMVLVGRSELPQDQDNAMKPSTSSAAESRNIQEGLHSTSPGGASEIIRTLNRFKEEKLNCQYYSCDVTDFDATRQLINKIEKDHGKITAVIHGAGLNTLKRLKQTNPDDAYHEAIPKVIGAINIGKALEHSPPKLFVGITSVIGVTGMEGSGWYGLANEILNLFLHQFRVEYRETEVATIAYSVWDEIGMGTKLGSLDWLSQRGISPIPVAEGVKRFMQLVEGDSGNQQTIVVARIAGIDTWKSPQINFRNGLRFIEDVKYCMPGVELIARSHLNIKDDSYVLDHNWKGTLLFPFVFGLEAMLQAVVFLRGNEDINTLKVKNVHLDKPISVNQENGAKIEIHAEVLESKGKDEEIVVKVEIFSEHDNFSRPAFSALIEITKKESGKNGKLKVFPDKTVDLNFEQNIYGKILFQGKSFQYFKQIHELFYDEKQGQGECTFTTSYNKSTPEFLRQHQKFCSRFLTGDPFFIDSLLQSMQLIVSQDACLPSYIDEIFFKITSSKLGEEILAQSDVRKISKDTLQGNVLIKPLNGMSLAIRGCQLKILDHSSDKPSANDLVDPTQRDQAIIEDKINELAQQMGFAMPVISYLYDPILKISSKQERHKIEIPFIQSAVRGLLKREKRKLKSIKVGWLRSGRPVLFGRELSRIKISLSHCDNSLICVAGHGEQGCDIENIIKRSEKDWLTLLGKRKFLLLENLINLGFDLDFGGTVVWSASETFKKLLNTPDIDFEFSDYYKNVIIFKTKEGNPKVNICSIPMELTRGSRKILSFSINAIRESEDIKNTIDIDIKTLRKIGFNENRLFGVNIDYSGPQKQLVMTQRFPVTFKTNQMLSRRVYFTNFFDWIGTIREYSVYPTFKELAKLAKSGEWGLVTNMTELKILGGIKCNDIVEAKIWGGALEGDKNATAPMFFEWFRITDGGQRERVAVAEQKSTWVSIRKDHSVVIERMPKFLGDYLDLVKPTTEKVFSRESCPEPYRNITLGNTIKSYSKDIVRKFKINEDIFSTTLENSNVVGNIYFANYARWLGAVGDKLFYKLIPTYFVNVADKNEIICLECNIYYLNDAFPFESILVEMYLDEIYENGLMLYFEFHRIKDGKKQTKLAYAKQKIVFAHWSNEIEPTPIKVPDSVKDFLKSKEPN